MFIVPATGSVRWTRMVTKFPPAESTLLVLVEAFAGRERVLAAYHHAVAAVTGSSATGTRCSCCRTRIARAVGARP